jgi:hypothetical protein
MRNLNRREAQPALFKGVSILLMGLVAMMAAGCDGERDSGDGQVINTIVLPTDVVLSLACANVGIAAETCVLDDPENPYVSTTIIEFDVNNPDAFNKFEIADGIPVGPTGAKARFYFWATALVRRQSGENQYYTALALHELFTANSNVLDEDELIKAHALKAYRSVLDNFFGGVLAFKCFTCAPNLPVDSPDIPQFLVPLNERVADHLYRQASTATAAYPSGLRRLPPGSTPIDVLDMFVDWGYSYQPCTDLPDCTNGVVGVGEF